jgi:hypothetical protein
MDEKWETVWISEVFPAGAGIFSSWPCLGQLWGPPSFLSNGQWGSFPRVKWLVYEADHSHPPSAKVKNARGYISVPPYVFMVWCLIKHITVYYINISVYFGACLVELNNRRKYRR